VLIQILCDDEAEDRVAEELQPLVRIRDRIVRRGSVAKGKPQKAEVSNRNIKPF